MGLIQLLLNNPAAFGVIFIPLVFSVIFHEIAHGLAALSFGDDTALRAGRLSLNPFRHIDPLGLLALLIIGFGWAKPVPVDYYKLKHTRLAFIVVALAGCAVNILIAFVAVFLLEADVFHGAALGRYALIVVARINVILAVFNLIPLPPLDGSKALLVLLPERHQRIFFMLQPYVIPVLALLLFTGTLDPFIRSGERAVFSLIKTMISLMHL